MVLLWTEIQGPLGQNYERQTVVAFASGVGLYIVRGSRPHLERLERTQHVLDVLGVQEVLDVGSTLQRAPETGGYDRIRMAQQRHQLLLLSHIQVERQTARQAGR